MPGARPLQRPTDGRLSGLNASLAESSRLFHVPVAPPAERVCCLQSQPHFTAGYSPKWLFCNSLANPREGDTKDRVPSTQPEPQNLTPPQAQAGKGRSGPHHRGPPAGTGLLPIKDPPTLGPWLVTHSSVFGKRGAIFALELFSNQRQVSRGRGGVCGERGICTQPFLPRPGLWAESAGAGRWAKEGQVGCCSVLSVDTCLGAGSLSCTPTISGASEAPHPPPAWVSQPSTTVLPGP